MCDNRKRTYCCVFGCLNNSSVPELSLFKLPTDQEERRLQWLRLIDREDLINKSQSKRVVCEAHFHPEDIVKNSARKLLKKNCVPRLNLPNLKKSDKHTQVEKTTSYNNSSQTERTGATSLCLTDIETTDFYYGIATDHYIDETTEQTQDKTYVQTNIVCNECEKEIVGFRYVCVQCADCDLCGACEARQTHRDHYVLRVPGARPHWEVSQILQRVREEIADILNTNDPNTEPEIFKPEIKEEPGPDPFDDNSDLRPHDSNIHEQTILNIEDVVKEEPESQCLEEYLEDDSGVIFSKLEVKEESDTQCVEECLEDDSSVIPTEPLVEVKSHATKRGRAGEGAGAGDGEGHSCSSAAPAQPHTRGDGPPPLVPVAVQYTRDGPHYTLGGGPPPLAPISTHYTKRKKIIQASESAVVAPEQETSREEDGGSCSYEVFTHTAHPADKQTTTIRAPPETKKAVKRKGK